MKRQTPETIKASKSNSSINSFFYFTVEKIDFTNPRQTLFYKAQLAHRIANK
ncbi:unnamed protein product [Paramecium octaurelia]|uniref:Uncharacterized protein n=1 Tax=Paramecium octaurelia TaxID=43137 RepID=A0A8S1VYR2_PAROT|nr:unnamed protein product [Paramecium octaurelia]